MKANRVRSSWLACVVAFGLASASSQAQQISFDHLNAGAVGTNQSDKLIWANGALFPTNAGYYRMTYATAGTYAGYYNSSPTMTALAGTTNHAGPVPFAPALGSFIQAQVTLISAPVGGLFSFWTTTNGPAFTLNVGDSTSLIPLSGGSDNPTAGDFGADPFGHIHGRRFASTAVGDYIVGFQLFDTSINGFNGGPIHTPSDVLYVDFRAFAVPEPGTLTLLGLGLAGIIWRARKPSQNRS